MKKFDVIVVGGGAAGMMAAGTAAVSCRRQLGHGACRPAAELDGGTGAGTV